MSNTATITENDAEKDAKIAAPIDKKHLVSGARAIAAMPIGSRIKDGEADLAAGDLLGIFYESQVVWQTALQIAVAADPVMKTLSSSVDRDKRRMAIATQMVDHHLSTR